MRNRRAQPTPGPSDNLGKHMLLKEWGLGPGMLGGESFLLLQCVAVEKGKPRRKTFTMGIPADEVDKFLTATQQGVAMYKAVQAREGAEDDGH